MTLATCPDMSSLHALLEESGGNREDLLRHIEICVECQEALQGIAAEPEVWQDTAAGLIDLLKDETALHEVVALLKEDVAPFEGDDRSFLAPADRPGILGMLGPYEVQAEIGCGSMGIVFKALDPALNRVVALKVLAPRLASSATARRRFLREGRAVAALCHDHIVTVYSVNEFAGLPYLVMQFVAGESLQTRLDRSGALEIEEVVRIGAEIASGLAAAHARGLIHRDIKPANLLLEERPNDANSAHVKITDFGLVRMADDVQLTQNGVVTGTPLYMAPEQARGEAVDSRADLFSLGSVLYALCTGRPPFLGTTALAVIRQVNDQAPASPQSLNPAVPDWLSAIIGRLLAKNPNERFQSAAEVGTLLQGWLAHLQSPTTLPRPVKVDTPRMFKKTQMGLRRLLAGVGCIAGLALVAATFWLLGAGEPGKEAKKPIKGPPAKDVPVAAPPTDRFDVFSIAISSDGKFLAAGGGLWDRPGEIGVWSFDTFKPLHRFSDDRGLASVVFSRDGKLLASGGWSGHVKMRDWAADKEVADFPVNSVARVSFSPDGKLLASATESMMVQLWDVAEKKAVADLEGDMARFHCVAFSPDGNRLAAAGGDWKQGGRSHGIVWDVGSRKQMTRLNGHLNTILTVVWSPDGAKVATGSVDTTIRLWDSQTGALLRMFVGHTKSVDSVIFADGGKTLVSSGHDRTLRFWDAESGVEREERRRVLPIDIRSMALSQDGKKLAIGGPQKTLKIIDLATGAESASLWNGLNGPGVAMDAVPVAEAARVHSRGWLAAALVMGLVMVLFLAIAGAMGTYAVRRRRSPNANAPAMEAGPNSLSITCDKCAKKLKVRAELAGKTVKCPGCGRMLTSGPVRASRTGIQAKRRLLLLLAAAGVAASTLAACAVVAFLWAWQGSAAPAQSELREAAQKVKLLETDTIDARNCARVTDEDLAVLHGLPNLKRLNLDHTEITNEGMKDIGKVTSLIHLSLTNTQIDDRGLAEVKNAIGLEDLRLDRVAITDAGLVHLESFPQLRKLSLFHTKTTDKGLAHVKKLFFLEHLSLDETEVSDQGLGQLTDLANLRYISLWRTNVTESGVDKLRAALPLLKVNK